MTISRILVCGVALALTLTTVADDAALKERAKRFKPDAGGYVVKPGTGIGKVSIIDTQDRVAFDVLTNLVAESVKVLECNIVAEKAKRDTPEKLKSASGATIALVLIDDPAEPTMLLAPEEHWGTVNVAKLVDDLPTEKAKAKFLPIRAKKECLRGFSILCGGGSSQFEGNAMNAATIRELDTSYDWLPADIIDGCQRYLRKVGVVPEVRRSYIRACIEGWAPQPVNAEQKEVWDFCQSIPKKGAAIKFDPKKGK